MYYNLLAEIEKRGLSKKEVATISKIPYTTLLDRLNGRHIFTLEEAIKIRDLMFPGMNIEYLFATDKEEEVVK